MKAISIIITAFIVIVTITSGQAYFDALTSGAEKTVFAYNDDAQGVNVQMKPLSRGDAVDRKSHEADLKLMTFNMHRGIGKGGKLDLKAISDVIKANDANIIGLQEVERYSIRTGFKDQIKYLSNELEMNYAFGKSLNVLNGEYGNGLLSKYPIEEYKTYELPSYSEQRTVLRAVINIAGNRLAVYNTHLGLKEAERKEQQEFILQLVDKEPLDYILMGDMNSRAAKLTTITSSMKDSAAVMKKQDKNTFIEGSVQERIDYIFVSNNITIMDYDVYITEASDHNAVVCRAAVIK